MFLHVADLHLSKFLSNNYQQSRIRCTSTLLIAASAT